MKTKELIKRLQELDPEGEFEVFSDDGNIFAPVKLPWYYDGTLGIIIPNDSEFEPFNIKGLRQINSSDKFKIYLYSYSMDDLAVDSIEIDDFSIEGDEKFKQKYKEKFEHYHKEYQKVDQGEIIKL
jgi:hypothetical protein